MTSNFMKPTSSSRSKSAPVRSTRKNVSFNNDTDNQLTITKKQIEFKFNNLVIKTKNVI